MKVRLHQPTVIFGICLIVSLVLTLIIYGRTLGYPLYSDDLVQVPWLRTLTFAELWSTLSPYDYYRPLVFSIWWVLGAASSEVPIVLLRLVNLGLHATTAALTGTFLFHLDRERQIEGALLAALLFTAYPFAYQVVPWISGMFYPLMLSLVLFAAIAFLRAQETDRDVWLVAASLSAFLAPLAHDNGMLAAGLLLGLEAVRWWRERQVSVKRVIIAALPALYIVLWLLLRQDAPSTISFDAFSLCINAQILSTAVSYPLALLNILASPLLIWLAFLISVAFTLVLSRRQLEVGLYCLLWCGLTLVPVLIVMRPQWLVLAPRFLYPAGVGVAMLWAFTASEISVNGVHWREALGLMLVSFIMIPAVVYIGWALDHYEQGLNTLHQVAEIEAEHAQGQLNFVDLPNEIAPKRAMYPFFSGGAELLPSLVQGENLTGIANDQLQAWQSSISRGEVAYRYKPYGPLIGEQTVLDGQVYIVDYREDAVELDYYGGVLDAGSVESEVTFENVAGLQLADLLTWEDEVIVTLHWQVMEASTLETVFLHVIYSETGELVAQADGALWGGLLPLHLAQSVEDVRYIDVPSGLYEVYVGLWRPTTGERLEPSVPHPDNVYPLGSVEID